MGKLSRTKGHSFERDIAIDFQELGWIDARRQLEYHVKDALGVDLQDTEPFAVQCKRGRKYASITAIEEITTAEDENHRIGIRTKPNQRMIREGSLVFADEINQFIGHVPLLITKADRKPTMAVLPWDELKKLIAAAYPERRS